MSEEYPYLLDFIEKLWKACIAGVKARYKITGEAPSLEEFTIEVLESAKLYKDGELKRFKCFLSKEKVGLSVDLPLNYFKRRFQLKIDNILDDKDLKKAYYELQFEEVVK
jgi:hypothetical protein